MKTSEVVEPIRLEVFRIASGPIDELQTAINGESAVAEQSTLLVSLIHLDVSRRRISCKVTVVIVRFS